MQLPCSLQNLKIFFKLTPGSFPKVIVDVSWRAVWCLKVSRRRTDFEDFYCFICFLNMELDSYYWAWWPWFWLESFDVNELMFLGHLVKLVLILVVVFHFHNFTIQIHNHRMYVQFPWNFIIGNANTVWVGPVKLFTR